MVDVVGSLRIEVPDRVVAHCSEVDDGIEAAEVLAQRGRQEPALAGAARRGGVRSRGSAPAAPSSTSR
jgi:hypothetical protein